uniref:Uncharacterized protein n=3 Tax=Aegilops tauschii subsp. strangulata TaxID=200361 RepID=A0A453AUW1_AEGTS
QPQMQQQQGQKQTNRPTQQQQVATTPVAQDTTENPMLHNPARVPKKGRPTEKSRRRKTLLEQ